MNTTRNRSMVLAQFLRAAVKTLNDPRSPYGSIVNAVKSIEAVAEELETVADDSVAPLIVSRDERRAIEEVLSCATVEVQKTGRWALFAPGGWAGNCLTALLGRIPKR